MTLDVMAPEGRGSVDLSVVIITENEEDLVTECIESVFEACREVSSFEVILVDSASTDRTLEYATAYPITILRIPEEHTVSCGAGRYVGDRITHGDMVLHIDGDMTLTTEWLPRAIEQLEDPQVAAIEGNLDESNQSGIMEVDKVGGVMLYDAAALAEVGGFDPYLLGYEDVDVGFRLKEAGYRLLRLPEVSAIHHDDGAFSEPVRRWRRGYLTAPGQAIRKWAGSPPMLWRLLRRQRYQVALVAWLAVGVASGLSVLLLHGRTDTRTDQGRESVASMISNVLLVGWLGLSLVGFGVVKQREPVGAAQVGASRFFLAKGMGAVGLAVGMTKPTPDADTYPLEAVEVVQEGQVQDGSTSLKISR